MDGGALIALVFRLNETPQPAGGTDWPAWLTAIGTLVLAFGVLLGARQLSEARIGRLTEAAAEVSRRWDGDDLIAARNAINQFDSETALRDAVVKAMGIGSEVANPDQTSDVRADEQHADGDAEGDIDNNAANGDVVDLDLLFREPNFFDDLGAQELLSGISLQWIEFTMKDIVIDRWKLWQPTVKALRDAETSIPPVYGNFERLVDRLRGERLGPWERSKRAIWTWLVRRLDY